MSAQEWNAYYKSQVIASLVINSVLNGIIAFFLYRERQSLPLIEIAIDIQITVAIIAFFTAWIDVASARKKLAALLPAPAGGVVRLAGLALPRRAVLRAAWIMLALMLFYGGLALTGSLALVSPDGLSNWAYFAFKTLYTGGCGACAALLALWSVYKDFQSQV